MLDPYITLHHCQLSHISHTESWLDPSQSLSAAATPSRRRRSSDEEGDDESLSFMNETIVDEELIGTQFSLEQEQEEEEKDEVLVPKCHTGSRLSFFFCIPVFFCGLECFGPFFSPKKEFYERTKYILGKRRGVSKQTIKIAEFICFILATFSIQAPRIVRTISSIISFSSGKS
jgi:hypothetical protein